MIKITVPVNLRENTITLMDVHEKGMEIISTMPYHDMIGINKLYSEIISHLGGGESDE